MPTPRAEHQAEALGRQVIGAILSLFQEGLETGNKTLLRASYAPINWEEHANPTFRQILAKHLKIRLFTLTSPNPAMNRQLVPYQWIELKPEDVRYVQERIAEMRKDATKQLNKLLRSEATDPPPE